MFVYALKEKFDDYIKGKEFLGRNYLYHIYFVQPETPPYYPLINCRLFAFH